MINIEKQLIKLKEFKLRELDQIVAKLGVQFITLSDDKYDFTLVQNFGNRKVLICPNSNLLETTWKTFYRSIGNYDVPVCDFSKMYVQEGFKEIYLEDYPRILLFDSQKDYQRNLPNLVEGDIEISQIRFIGHLKNRLVRIE